MQQNRMIILACQNKNPLEFISLFRNDYKVA